MSDPKIDAIILFTDGSCVPNPGYGGWGFHGYAYSDELPKRGSGNADYYLTNLGYVEKTMLDAFRKGEDPYEKVNFENTKEGTQGILDTQMHATEVTPLFYVDYFGPGPIADNYGRSTNNASEIYGFLMALDFCQREDIRKIQIYADSGYTLDGWNKALPVWARNNWRRRDGEEIKNKDLWQRVWKIKNEMKDFDIQASWVPGHSIFLGNVMADTNANLGKNMSLAKIATPIQHRSEAQGYWKANEVDKHPLIAHQKLFFNGDKSTHVPGFYFMGAIDKDLGLFGKRLSDTSYSVIKLAEPVESLEALVTHHCEQGQQSDEMVIGHLAQFFKPAVYKQFTEYGHFSLYQAESFNNNLSTVDKQIVTEVVDPPKKSLEALLAMNNVATWMSEWLEQKPSANRYTETDLTPHLYESSIIKKKNKDVSVTKLKASIKPGVASIEVDANYRNSTGTESILPTILSFGIDLPDRNGLKRVEDMSPKVTMLSWEESPGLFRYFTVIQAGDDVGAYCGYYSNTRLNKTKKKTK